MKLLKRSLLLLALAAIPVAAKACEVVVDASPDIVVVVIKSEKGTYIGTDIDAAIEFYNANCKN